MLNLASGTYSESQVQVSPSLGCMYQPAVGMYTYQPSPS